LRDVDCCCAHEDAREDYRRHRPRQTLRMSKKTP